MTELLRLIRTARAVRRHPRAGRAELDGFRDARLRQLLVHAYERVPYYRKLFDRHRLHPRHIRGVVDLDLIPITSKQDLQRQPDKDVLASGVDPDRLLSVSTSGSSGEPLTVHRTWAEDKLQFLLAVRAFSGLGLRPLDQQANVALRRPNNPLDRKLIGRSLSALGINRSALIDGLREPFEIAQLLRRVRPDVITGMPGMLCRVADYLLNEGDESIRPRLLIVGGEVLTPVMRRQLTDAFRAPVRQTYASHEFPLIGWECVHSGEFHTADDGVILEVLRDGHPVGPGEPGEVVATNLHAYAMPFIRYRLADVVIQGHERCACGQPFSTIGSIQGRMLDLFTLPDGRVLHPYEIVTRFISNGDHWIRQYQLLQERPDRITLRVLPMDGALSEQVARVEQSVRPLLGPDVEFQVQLLDRMAFESSGKFRPVRSLVTGEPARAAARIHG